MGYTETPPKKVMMRGNGAQKDPQRAEEEVMGQLWGTEGQKGAVGQSLGWRQARRTTGKGTRGGLWGTQGAGCGAGRRRAGRRYGAGRETPPPGIRAPSSTQSPLRSCNVYWPRRNGALQQRGDAAAPSPPPPGLAPSSSSPHNSSGCGATGEEGLRGGGLCPNWGWWAQSSWDPPALVVPEQRGGPQSFEPQIAAGIK